MSVNQYIPYNRTIDKKIIHLSVFAITILLIHISLRFLITSDYKISFGSTLGYLTFYIWSLITQKNVKKIIFDDIEKKLNITTKSIFKKEENLEIIYSELNYKVKNHTFISTNFFGNKSLEILKNDSVLLKLWSNEEFNENQIINIAKNIESKIKINT